MWWIFSDLPQVMEQISKVHEEPVFLPRSFILGTLLPTIGIVTICLNIIYWYSLNYLVDKIAPPKSTRQQKIKIGYQITNTIFNVIIGCVGLYLEYIVLPSLVVNGKSIYNGPSVDKITGLEQELYIVSAMQLGYQFWAIPVGIFQVHESLEMIIHHFAVVISTSMSGFLTIGFRYYSPFFYGVMELSSIPLSVMNSFKENPELQKQYPGGMQLSRAIFAISFLLIRNILCFSRWPIFLRDNFLVLYTKKEVGFYKFYMLVQWLLAAFLAYLQLYWGSLILKGMFKLVTGQGDGSSSGGSSKKDENMKKNK